MDSVHFIALAIVIGTIGFLAIHRRKKRKQLPPGPSGLPYIGNAWQIDKVCTYLDLTELGKKYGDIFSIRMYGHGIVVIAGEELLRKALVTDSVSFAGRPRHVRIELLRENGFHVSFCDYGERLRNLKKSLLNCMRMYGDGLKRIEELVAEMTVEFLDKCYATKGKPHFLDDDIYEFMLHIMFSLACGCTLGKEDVKEFVEYENKLMPILGTGSMAMILDLIPWLKHFPLGIVKEAKVYAAYTTAKLNPLIKARKELFDGKNMECLVDAMLKYNADVNGDEQFQIQDIRAVVLEIIGAGIATSTSTMSYLLAMCTVRPEMQDKIRYDIDRNIGSRVPRLEDKSNIPYLEAAILETLRIMSNVPLFLPHKTTTDVEFEGYNIPRNTQVWMNSWALHHDERYWEDPWAFKPERFLAEDGSVVTADHINRRRLMPFGAGRRVCMGETMAKGRLFLLITILLQRFTILPEAEDKLPDTDPRHLVPGLVLHPPFYKLRLVPRV